MTPAKHYLTKERLVEAIQFDANPTEIGAFLPALASLDVFNERHLAVRTPGQTLSLHPGFWLLRHPEGDLETLTDEQFRARYTASAKRPK
jgi:hypothetical protein